MKTKTIKIHTTIKTVENFYPKYFIVQAFIILLSCVNFVTLNAMIVVTLANAMYLAIDFMLDNREDTVSIKNDGLKDNGD